MALALQINGLAVPWHLIAGGDHYPLTTRCFIGIISVVMQYYRNCLGVSVAFYTKKQNVNEKFVSFCSWFLLIFCFFPSLRQDCAQGQFSRWFFDRKHLRFESVYF